MHDRALVTHPTTQRKSGYSCSSRGSTQASAERGAPAAENDAPFEGGLTVATAEARAAGTREIVAAKVNLDNPLRDSTEVGHDVAVTEVLPVTRSTQVPRRRRTPESSEQQWPIEGDPAMEVGELGSASTSTAGGAMRRLR